MRATGAKVTDSGEPHACQVLHCFVISEQGGLRAFCCSRAGAAGAHSTVIFSSQTAFANFRNHECTLMEKLLGEHHQI